MTGNRLARRSKGREDPSVARFGRGFSTVSLQLVLGAVEVKEGGGVGGGAGSHLLGHLPEALYRTASQSNLSAERGKGQQSLSWGAGASLTSSGLLRPVEKQTG